MNKVLPYLLLLLSLSVFSQTEKDSSAVKVRYGHKGFELTTADDRFEMQIRARLQLRAATPGDQNPLTYDDFQTDNKTVFKINRARLKVGGHAYESWLKYYFEYELSQSNLLDFRVMLEKWDFLSFKAGQWKVEFSRERFISSGEQQMVDRSLINREFTLDRQQGIEIYGHLKGKGIIDFNYWVAALTGTGRGNTANDDNNLMYFGRLQWNFLGREVGFESSDLEFHEKPAAIIAFSAATNRSPYTRFSQAGGGYITGFENGLDGQYRVNQNNLETAFVYRGFSGQAEWHHKNIFDKLNEDQKTRMRGYYFQGGYFFHYLLDWFPKKMEIAARYAEYKPNIDLAQNLETETSIACNWFFHGHACKLTGEGSYFSYQDKSLPYEGGWRFRLQLDISF